jgi:hypothetical protein
MHVPLRDKIVFYNWREVQYTECYDQVIMCIKRTNNDLNIEQQETHLKPIDELR